jgi:hypothetical protein
MGSWKLSARKQKRSSWDGSAAAELEALIERGDHTKSLENRHRHRSTVEESADGSGPNLRGLGSLQTE